MLNRHRTAHRPRRGTRKQAPKVRAPKRPNEAPRETTPGPPDELVVQGDHGWSDWESRPEPDPETTLF